ncbi:MAG: polysaccharide deacetylase family protein [Candidatus Zixiibacteriota bacterium]
MSEAAEDSPGGVIRINAGFCEKNQNAEGNPLADYQGDAQSGDRIVAEDPNLKDASLSIRGKSGAGRWRLTFAENIRIWEKADNGKYAEIASSVLSDEIKTPFSAELKVEGIEGSRVTNDVKILAEFFPDKSTRVYQDSVFLTVIETKFALSFDDGPLPEKTKKIVGALKGFYSEGNPVRAVFFEIGARVQNSPGLTRLVDQNGHLVGNHTMYHEHYGHAMLNTEDLRQDIVLCETEIRKALGREPEKIVRSRSLMKDYAFDSEAQKLGYRICGGELLNDWDTSATVQKIEQRAEEVLQRWNTRENPKLHPYPAVLIFHEFSEVTCDHIAEIVGYLQDHGFVLVNFDPTVAY